MTELFKPMPFGFPRGERQNRIQSVEGLDSALFIDTEDRRVDRRLEVQANSVGDFLFKLRVIAGHVSPQPMMVMSSS
jgi:hypothetical protein